MKQTTFEEFVELARRGTFVPGGQGDHRRPADAGLGVPEDRRALRLRLPVRERRGRRARRALFVPRQGSVSRPAPARRARRSSIDRASRTESDEPFVAALRRLMAEFQSPFVPGLPRFTGGAVGFIGYDASPVFEPALLDAWAQGAVEHERHGRSRERGRSRLHAVRYGARVRSRQAPDPDHRQRAGHGRRGSAGALPVRLRQDPVPRARARARPVAAGRRRRRRRRSSARTWTRETLRSGRAHDQGAHRRRATSTRRCCRSVSRRTSPPIRSRSTARCATSTRRRTCISSAWAGWRSSDRRRRCWCGSKGGASRRTRSPARGRAAATRKTICGSARS